jgi:hypothetical protein
LIDVPQEWHRIGESERYVGVHIGRLESDRECVLQAVELDRNTLASRTEVLRIAATIPSPGTVSDPRIAVSPQGDRIAAWKVSSNYNFPYSGVDGVVWDGARATFWSLGSRDGAWSAPRRVVVPGVRETASASLRALAYMADGTAIAAFVVSDPHYPISSTYSGFGRADPAVADLLLARLASDGSLAAWTTLASRWESVTPVSVSGTTDGKVQVVYFGTACAAYIVHPVWGDLSGILWVRHTMRKQGHGYAEKETNGRLAGSGPRAAA